MISAKESERKELGCAVRALASITGQPALDAEWDLRVAQVKASEKSLFHSLEQAIRSGTHWSGEEGGKFVQEIKDRECADIRNLMIQIANGSSPIGQQLNNLVVRERSLPVDELRQLVQQGFGVMGVSFVRSSWDNRMRGHAYHIGLDGDGFISKSDGCLPIRIKDGVRAFVFEPK